MIEADAPHYEDQYLALMRRVWTTGDVRVDRTGIGTRSVFGEQLRFDLRDGRVPLLTTKRVYWKAAAREMLWFLTGVTNIRPLLQQGVKIWTDWPLATYRRETGDMIDQAAFEAKIVSDQDFADRWGDLGPVYGKQWVNWSTYEARPDGLFQAGAPINQLQQLVEALRTNPSSRRHIFTGWNVADVPDMALPPCHMTYQFHVSAAGGLSCLLFQRSCDVALGLPFNLFGAALLTAMLAQQCDLVPTELIWSGGDVHLYQNHAALVETQMQRTPQGDPRLVLGARPASLFEYTIDTFSVVDYAPQAAISAPVAV